MQYWFFLENEIPQIINDNWIVIRTINKPIRQTFLNILFSFSIPYILNLYNFNGIYLLRELLLKLLPTSTAAWLYF